MKKAKAPKSRYSYSVVLTPEPEGGYTVTVPALPEAITYGKTIEDALKYAEEAIQLSIECREKAGEKIPQEFSPVATSVVTVTRTHQYA